MLMWLDHYSSACRECPDLVAVYEAIDGRLALLLRQTLVPLPEESPAFRRATRSAARIIVDKLRAAGFRRGFIVLQWHPLGPGADIMRTWPCRYEADPARRAQLTAVAERYAADECFLASRVQLERGAKPKAATAPPPFALSGELHELQSWYDAMAPSWLSVEPLLRRAPVPKGPPGVAPQNPISAAQRPTPPPPRGGGAARPQSAAPGAPHPRVTSRSVGSFPVDQLPPSALIRSTLAVSCRPAMPTAACWLVSAAVCATTTFR